MPKRVAITSLNASTIDILNVIRQNASAEYQSLVPVVTQATDIPKVGDVLYGYPAMANQFLNALINRIALVKVKSAVFNNAYAELKKGYLEFGETVEEVFVSIAKAREFSAEKAEAREFKRTIPDVRSAFHTMNWRVQYPVTIQNEDLRMAFTSINGVEDLIARIVDSIYTAAEYDEFLLFKYLLIKAWAKGGITGISVDTSDMKNCAKAFRGMSNQLTFMTNKYNNAGVTTTTPKADQYIFMDAQFNANYDVDVLASAFNMDKATFMGKLKLIDDFNTFDNDRFDIIRAGSDMIEPVTDEELALMNGVKAILVDSEWFQVYDNANQFTEQYVASGMYWNYFYNVWKTVSWSPFSNIVVFTEEGFPYDTSVDTEIQSFSIDADTGVGILTILPPEEMSNVAIEFIQTEELTRLGIAVHKYGAFIIPSSATSETVDLKCKAISANKTFTCSDVDLSSISVGDTLTFTMDT